MGAGKPSCTCTMSLWRHGCEWYELVLRRLPLYIHQVACLSHSTTFHTTVSRRAIERRHFQAHKAESSGTTTGFTLISDAWRCVVLDWYLGVLLHLSSPVFLLALMALTSHGQCRARCFRSTLEKAVCFMPVLDSRKLNCT